MHHRRGSPLVCPLANLALVSTAALALSGCYAMRSSSGGGEASFEPPRRVDASQVALPAGYRLSAVATGLTFPTGVAFDETGGVYVVESGYSYGETWTTPRLLRVEPGGALVEVARGGDNGPWNGVDFHDGAFFVAEGGRRHGGKLLRIDPSGEITPLVESLPSRGDHHVNGPVVGGDGWLYFGIGTATNSGVVGEDSAHFGWLKDHPDFHDIPCRDITLSGVSFTTADVRRKESETEVETGAFAAFGTNPGAGAVIRGQVPCSGAVLKIRPDGGPVELVAWGFRNPFGLAFAPDARLYVADNSYDVRGSRPVYGAGDLLWEVKPGTWYGWPDYHGARRIDDDDHFQAPGKDAPRLVLAAPPGTPPEPAAYFGVHASADGMDFSRSQRFGHVGELFVAQFGDQTPATGKVLAPVGYKVVRVQPLTGAIEDFLANKGKVNGPASRIGGGGLERPVAARFDRTGAVLYVVDFGVVLQDGEATRAQPGTGILWRVERADTRIQ